MTCKAHSMSLSREIKDLPMKLLVAGGRNIKSEEIVMTALNDFFEEHDEFLIEDTTLINGKAPGVDSIARNLFKSNGYKYEDYPANWKDFSEPCIVKKNNLGEYNALAGMKRNTTMSGVADILLAIWDGKSTGTKDMITKMENLGKPVYIIYVE